VASTAFRMPEGLIWGCGMSCDSLRACAMRPRAPMEGFCDATVRRAEELPAGEDGSARVRVGGRVFCVDGGIALAASARAARSAKVGSEAGFEGSGAGAASRCGVVLRRKRLRRWELRMCRTIETVAHRRTTRTRIEMAMSIRMVTPRIAKLGQPEVYTGSIGAKLWRITVGTGTIGARIAKSKNFIPSLIPPAFCPADVGERCVILA